MGPSEVGFVKFVCESLRRAKAHDVFLGGRGVKLARLTGSSQFKSVYADDTLFSVDTIFHLVHIVTYDWSQ